MSLPITCRSAGHHVSNWACVGAEADRRRVVDQRIEPDVDHARRIGRQRNAPRLPGAADRDVLQAGLEQAEDLVAPHLGLQEVRMLGKVRQQPIAIGREPEEVVALLDPVRLRAVDRAQPVDQVLLLLEGLAADAVPALVVGLIQVAGGRDAVDDRLDRRLVARLCGADEVVEREVERRPHLAELLLHAIAVLERVLAEVASAAEDVLRVLVVAHHEVRVDPAQALVSGDDVGGDLLVRRAEMRPAVDVIDGGREVEARHGVVSGSACRGREGCSNSCRPESRGLPR